MFRILYEFTANDTISRLTSIDRLTSSSSLVLSSCCLCVYLVTVSVLIAILLSPYFFVRCWNSNIFSSSVLEWQTTRHNFYVCISYLSTTIMLHHQLRPYRELLSKVELSTASVKRFSLADDILFLAFSCCLVTWLSNLIRDIDSNNPYIIPIIQTKWLHGFFSAQFNG